MSAPPTAPGRSRRRRAWWTLGAVVLVVGVVVGGPWAYARFLAPVPPAPLVLEEEDEPATQQGPVDVDGPWTVGPGSQAGYRLDEILSGEPVTVVGRTEDVTGTLEVADGVLTSARVTVDVATVVTDESARDAYFRRALDTSTYPHAVFELDAPVDVSAVGASPQRTPLALSGTFTLHGHQVAAVLEAVARRTPEGIVVAGSLPVVLEDHGLTAPDLPFVTVEPAGTVEVLLVLVPAS